MTERSAMVHPKTMNTFQERPMTIHVEPWFFLLKHQHA
jgi:hypothetical protein